MPIQSAYQMLESVAEEALRFGRASADGALLAQAAFVRSVVDEVQRHHPSERWVAPLHEQLAEEIGRLERMLARAPGVSGDDRPVAVDQAAPVEILAVDDDPAALASMALALRVLGYVTRVALGPQEALRAYDDRPADIVITDWSMPGMSGLELCAALRRKRATPLYVILVSAFHDDAELRAGACGCADDLMGKPVDLAELEVRLSAASRFVRAMRSVARLDSRLRARG